MEQEAQVRTLDYLTVTVQSAEVGDPTVIEVSGEIDMLTAPVLQQAIDEQNAARSLLVDLSGVSYLGASGLAVLGRGIARAGRTRRDFRVISRDGAVRRSLQLLKVA
ncbi:STAS domain-containing protein [Saccharothrix isguenensis]